MATPKELFESQISDHLQNNPDKIAGIEATYQFDLEGDDGGTWNIALTDGKGAVGEGAAENADCTIKMTDGDFVSMIQGSLNPMTAFMSGKIRVTGEIGLAMKLQNVLG